MNGLRLLLTAALYALLCGPVDADAQSRDSTCVILIETADLAGIAGGIARAAALRDTTHSENFVFRRSGLSRPIDACAAPAALREQAVRHGRLPVRGLRLTPITLLSAHNSAYPTRAQDGALWTGRGLNAAVAAGVEVRFGPLHAALAPVTTWQSNKSFDLPPQRTPDVSDFAHRWLAGNIDMPARFGGTSFGTLDLGSSFLRFDLAGFGAGVSNENIIWGPAVRNPLMLSGGAPGFPHVFLETSGPRNIGIGAVEAQLFWGRLSESEFFDEDPDNDVRVLAGFLFAFNPRVFDGLSLGFGRLQSLTYWPEMSLGDAFLEPYRGVGDNRLGRSGDNQLISLFFRWVSGSGGLEAYGEWAREDHWEKAVGLLRNLDASQAWTLGLQKLISVGNDAWVIRAETSHLSDALPYRLGLRTGPVSFYTHTAVTQGHTHRGQLLGAPIGTGSESQFLGVDWYRSGRRTGVSLDRTRYEDDTYVMLFADDHGSAGRDTELTVRLDHRESWRRLSLDAGLAWSRRFNRDFVGLSQLQAGAEYPRTNNLGVRLGVRFTPGRAHP